MLCALDDRRSHELVGLAERPEQVDRAAGLVHHLPPHERTDIRVGRGEADRMREVLRQDAALVWAQRPLARAADGRETVHEACRQPRRARRGRLDGRAERAGRHRPSSERRIPRKAVGSEAERRQPLGSADERHRWGVTDVSRSDTSSS